MRVAAWRPKLAPPSGIPGPGGLGEPQHGRRQQVVAVDVGRQAAHQLVHRLLRQGQMGADEVGLDRLAVGRHGYDLDHCPWPPYHPFGRSCRAVRSYHAASAG